MQRKLLPSLPQTALISSGRQAQASQPQKTSTEQVSNSPPGSYDELHRPRDGRLAGMPVSARSSRAGMAEQQAVKSAGFFSCRIMFSRPFVLILPSSWAPCPHQLPKAFRVGYCAEFWAGHLCWCVTQCALYGQTYVSLIPHFIHPTPHRLRSSKLQAKRTANDGTPRSS